MQRQQEFLTRAEVCRLLKISPTSIDRLRREGRLTGFVLKRRRLFTREEVEALVQEVRK